MLVRYQIVNLVAMFAIAGCTNQVQLSPFEDAGDWGQTVEVDVGVEDVGASKDAREEDAGADFGSTVDLGAWHSPSEYDEQLEALNRSADWTPDDFLNAYAPDFAAGPPYDPMQAEFLPAIQASSFGLTSTERARLAADGFTYTSTVFPSFIYGYRSLYVDDLPVFVSADSILYAVHHSYDEILKRIEERNLVGALSNMVNSLRTRLQQLSSGFTAEQAQDLDVFLAVAASLIGQESQPVAGGNPNLIHALSDKARGAEGSERISLFGADRDVDWSQFKPRGHYTSEQLSRYFQATMWLSRIDFRMLEADERNELHLRRRQFYDMLAVAELFDSEATSSFRLLHDTMGEFVGEPDGMTLDHVPDLLQTMGISDVAEASALTDDEIAQALVKYQFGRQRVSSHIMINGIDDATKPLSYSFSLLAQRYVVDSHVFSNLVWDRAGSGAIDRMMPSPLDVAFAALGNDQAGMLLADELRTWGYQHDLDAMRQLVDAHPDGFWTQNLYNEWLASLRALSPGGVATDGRPSVALTEPWGRRLLVSQLASWAQLRHDTLLYAKQSYSSGGDVCEYPDAYVDPYPEFYAAIAAYAARGMAATAGFDPEFGEHFMRLQAAALHLESMAIQQRSGMPHDPADVAWINDAVVVHEGLGCGGPFHEGWYADLFFDVSKFEFDPTIADVHTQPTERDGTTVGRVLHVGTGYVRGLVVTVDTCVGPRAYAGLASTYYEHTTSGFDRMDDEDWAATLLATPPPQEPAWVP